MTGVCYSSFMFSYCELPEIVVEKLAVWDEYESDYTAFDVCGIEVRVLDDDFWKFTIGNFPISSSL